LQTARAPGADLPATLLARARTAVAKAKAYIESRQSTSGGFCFYRSEYVDEPNLHDTYHAVAALTLLRAEVPRAGELARFLDEFSLLGSGYYYYYALLIDAARLARIGELAVTPPPSGARIVTSGWLQGVLRTIRLKRRFAGLRALPQVADFINSLKADGGYGDKPNLCDTRLCLSILALISYGAVANDTRDFVDRLQRRPFGFALTNDSLAANLDVLYAGMKCCAMLGVSVRYRADASALVLACQTSNGGFARAPVALPDIELTRRALQIMGLIDQSLLSSAI
jgi:hypothetical protein